MKDSTQIQVLSDNTGLCVGDTSAIAICPYCLGGQTKERSFSVTRNSSGLLYICFRATCGQEGFIRTHGTAYAPSKPQAKKLRPYTGEFLHLERSDRRYFKERFGLSELVTFDFYYNEQNNYVLPIFAPDGHSRGNVVRRPWDGAPRTNCARTKACTYMHEDGPLLSWYGINQEMVEYMPGKVSRWPVGVVVLVEDQISAMKVAQAGHVSAALLGCNLTADKVREIAQQVPIRVVIALDADATETAFTMARKWHAAFDSLRVAILKEDLKDSPEEDILTILGLA